MKKFNTALLSLLSVSLIAACSGNTGAELQTVTPDETGEISEEADFDFPEEETIEPTYEEDEDIDEVLSADSDNALYIDFINNYDSYDWDRAYPDSDYGYNAFQLIDLDGDEVLDLVATNTDPDRFDAGMQCYVIVTIRDGKLAISEIVDGVASAGGYRGSKYYIEGEGVIYDESIQAPYGAPGFSVFELADDGVIIPVNGAYFEPDEDFDGDLEKGKWFWDSEEVSSEKIDEIISSYTEMGHCIAFSGIDYVDKETILNTLSK
ncbi:MAG: hypothetical protein K5776_04340 [Lachnospiraceae bacterium]|nr:hypothetical protein [Lachnospiraceae bacterium]